MDLLTIIQERIYAKHTKTRCSVDNGTNHVPADTHDAPEIAATDAVIETVSCTTDNDVYDAFSEPVLTVACNPLFPTSKNEHVMPENDQSPNDQTRGASEAPATRRSRKQSTAKVKFSSSGELDLFPEPTATVPPGITQAYGPV